MMDDPSAHAASGAASGADADAVPADGAARDGAAQEAAAAAAALAEAWAADPAAAAAVLRYRAARRAADEPAPDSCAVLEGMQAAYAAFGVLSTMDAEAVRRFEAAEARYAAALARVAPDA
jgi:hypothetical protein